VPKRNKKVQQQQLHDDEEQFIHICKGILNEYVISFVFYFLRLETSDPRFHLTDVNGKLVATGQKVPQTTVHGRKLTSEWAAFQVTMVVDTNAKPWDAYPTHSGQVEQGSFVAWPLANAKQVEPASMRKREATSLIDGLHPDFGRGSPSALVNQPRQSRLKSKKWWWSYSCPSCFILDSPFPPPDIVSCCPAITHPFNIKKRRRSQSNKQHVQFAFSTSRV